MVMMRKPKSSEPSLRDKLSADFLIAFQSDFAENGAAVISRLREKSPEKYAEIASRLIAAAEPPTSLEDYSRCKTVEDVGKQLLLQMGADESRISDWMIQAAVEANGQLVDRLATIIADAGSYTGSKQ
jgi:hypothetical protein